MSRVEADKQVIELVATSPVGEDQRIASVTPDIVDAVWGGYAECRKIKPLRFSFDGAKALVVIANDASPDAETHTVRTRETASELVRTYNQYADSTRNAGYKVPAPKVSYDIPRIIGESARALMHKVLG